MQHTHYGELQGSVEGKGGEFFKKGWWLWLLTPIALITYVGIPFVYALFKAVQMRWWLNGLRLGGVRVESRLDIAAFLGLYWKVIGWVILSSVVLLPWLALAAVVAGAASGEAIDLELFQNVEIYTSIPFIVMAVIGYFGWAMAMNIFIRLYLVRDMWQRTVTSMRIHGIEAAANVAAKGDLANALGEGFADGLDVGGF
jgi:uncharacterized membrane protein YjgN (DUF898 family)